jgi:hypothetical protein
MSYLLKRDFNPMRSSAGKSDSTDLPSPRSGSVCQRASSRGDKELKQSAILVMVPSSLVVIPVKSRIGNQ